MDYFDRYDEDEEDKRPEPRCNRCGSTAVRWRQQTGKWVLFNLEAGQEHQCDGRGKLASAEEFD